MHTRASQQEYGAERNQSPNCHLDIPSVIRKTSVLIIDPQIQRAAHIDLKLAPSTDRKHGTVVANPSEQTPIRKVGN